MDFNGREQGRDDIHLSSPLLPGRHGRHGRLRGPDKLGIEISDASDGGVRVDRVENEIQEIEPGDVIIELNGPPVKTVQDLKRAASKVKGGTTALAKVRRGRLIKYAAIPPQEVGER